MIERVTGPAPLASLWLLASLLWKQEAGVPESTPCSAVLQVMHGKCGQKSVRVGQPKEGGAGHQESEGFSLLGVCKVQLEKAAATLVCH